MPARLQSVGRATGLFSALHLLFARGLATTLGTILLARTLTTNWWLIYAGVLLLHSMVVRRSVAQLVLPAVLGSFLPPAGVLWFQLGTVGELEERKGLVATVVMASAVAGWCIELLRTAPLFLVTPGQKIAGIVAAALIVSAGALARLISTPRPTLA
jgi:hypothetical protein